jgi:two-component system response regulator YesN
VQDYLLKSIDEAELIQVVSKIKVELDEEFKNQYTSTNRDSLVRDKLLLDVVTGKHSSFEELENSNLIKIKRSTTNFSVALVRIENISEIMDGNKNSGELIRFGIRNILKDLFEITGLGYVYEDINELLGIIVFSEEVENFENVLFKQFSKASSYVTSFFKCHIDVGIGNIAEDFKDIKISRKQALYALDRKFMFADTFLIPYSKVVMDESIELNIQWDNSLMLAAVEELDYREINNQISLLVKEIIYKKLSRDILNGVIFNIFFALQHLIKKHDKAPHPSIDMKSMLNFINSSKSIKDLEAWLNEICINVGTHIVELNASKTNNIIDKVIDYVDMNFHLDLSLKTISNQFYLNSAYLGRQFKNVTGESFIDYLNIKRISKVKKLYVSSSLRMTDILYDVGYKNPEYFYRLFKKYEGISFSEYSETIKNLRKNIQL